MKPKALAKRVLQNSRLRNAARICVYSPTDVFEMIAGKKPTLVPPRGMRFSNTKTYVSLGKINFNYLIRLCELQPDHKVLDVGCGTGSMALPLLDYLSSGSYEGFDIVSSWISWCQKNISRRNPRFRFKFVDVYSKQYNSSGKLTSETLQFPYDNAVFDCAMLMSVFTHMLPGAIRNYIHELSRVMKTGAKAFVTTFLLNEESEAAIGKGKSLLSFRYHLGDCMVIDEFFPEAAIAVPEQKVMLWLSDVGLRVSGVTYGSWAGRPVRENLHDNLILQKL
jgi:cyclopropane fatty-acyl-phospholipid synthase-like methyltransferase